MQAEYAVQRIALPIRLRQRIRHRGRRRRAARGPELAATGAARTLRRATQRQPVHRAARHQPAHLDLSHPPLASPTSRTPNPPAGHACAADRSTKCPTPPNQLRWDPFRHPRPQPTDFVDGLVTIAGNGDPAAQTGVAIHVYAANRRMQARYFYNADGELLIVPQLGRAAHRHRTRRARCRARRDLRHPARHQVPRRSAGRRGARLHLRELRRAVPPARTGPDRRQRPRQSRAISWRPVAAFEDRDARVAASSPNSSAACGSRRSITRRSTWWPGTATTRPTSTISRASTASTR